VIAALAHAQSVYEFADAAADLVFVTPSDEASAQDDGETLRERFGLPAAVNRYSEAGLS
jgi:hypothetical protein